MAAKENVRYIGLDGRNNLVVSNNAFASTTKWVYVDSIDKFPRTYVKYPLAEVTIDQIKTLRRTEIPSFLLKENGKYYYAKIPSNMNLTSSCLLGRHQCSCPSHVCAHLSAATDEEGGCVKVRDLEKEIERYPFISCGYETFNCKHNCFVVLSCNHFEIAPLNKAMTLKERKEAHLLLAQFVWEDVDTIEEVRKRTHSNFEKLHNFSK